MKHKLSYYFSNEFIKKNKQEKLSIIKELITNYDNEYNSYESISFTVKQFDEKTKKMIKNVKTFIIVFIIASFTIFNYILLKSFEVKINLFYFLLISLIIAFLFIIDIVKELKKEKETKIKSIELNQNILKIIFEDNQQKEYNIKNINLTSKIINNKDNSHINDYLITIQEKNKLIKEKYHLNATQVENEFFAFLIFIKCLMLSIDIKDLNDNQFQTLYSNIYNNNKGLDTRNNIKIFLISGITLSILSCWILLSIVSNIYTMIKYDKVTANITGHNNISRYNNDGERIHYTQIEIKYEYNNITYYDTLMTDYNIFNRIIKKKTIYVNQNSPQQYDYFRYENILLCLITTYFSYFLLKKHKNLNQLS